jgi:hypothetical protein
LDFIYVDSESVDQIGYDEFSSELHIIFKGNRHYVYIDVTKEKWEEFRDCSSKGTYVNQEFRAKSYNFRKM